MRSFSATSSRILMILDALESPAALFAGDDNIMMVVSPVGGRQVGVAPRNVEKQEIVVYT